MNLSHPLPQSVSYEMLTANFWLNPLPQRDNLLHTSDTISTFNKRVYNILGFPEVTVLPESLSSEDVIEQIRAYFVIAEKPRYGGNAELLEKSYFEGVFHNALPEMPPYLSPRFGLTVRRTHVRSFPSPDLIMAEPYDFGFDLTQETSIDVGWPVAVLANSRDGQWVFCLTPLYWGWVLAADIAVGTRQQVEEYANPQNFLRTTANQGLVAMANGGGITPQMGTQLPLVEENDTLYRVRVPVKDANGTLDFACGYIHKAANQFHKGNLPCTLTNIFTQAFSLIGEEYTWGGSRLGAFGRDCSQFIKDVYATTGLFLPRNGDQQGKVGKVRVAFTSAMSDAERIQAIIEHGVPGDVLVIPTHVMIYLGHLDGTPYIIHDVTSGQNRVIVSDLMLGENVGKKLLLSRLTSMVGVE